MLVSGLKTCGAKQWQVLAVHGCSDTGIVKQMEDNTEGHERAVTARFGADPC